jgi:hypothetical protein
LRAEINCLQRYVTRRLYEWRNDQWIATLESLDPAVEYDQEGDEISSSVYPLVTPGTFALSDSDKA